MISNLSILNDISLAIRQAIRVLFGRLSAIVYEFIEVIYNLFITISKAEILDNEFVQAIYRKVGLILGLFMLFKLTFSLIQALIDPDKFTDKKTGFTAIITRSIVSIVLLGITPTIFKEAFKLQNIIVGSDNTNNIIYKIIVGNPTMGYSDSFGRELASDLFFSFYEDEKPPLYDQGTIYDEEDKYKKVDFNTLEREIRAGDIDFDYTVNLLYLKENGEYVIEFNEIFSLLIGVIVLWMVLMFTIQITIRVIQLAYLQLIAPVPILSYISDPEGAFKKWINQCTTTFLDLFIRLAIIYFVIYLSNYISAQFANFDSNLVTSLNIPSDAPEFKWVKIFIIVGLLLFAKRVPELLKDLFPSMGGGAAGLSFGLKAPKEVSSFAKGATTFGTGLVAGGVAGLATGIKHGEGVRGKIAGGLGGVFRGAASAKTKGNIFKNAQSGISNVKAANQRAYEKHHDGSSFWGRKMPVHASRVADDFERELQMYKDYDSAVSIVEKELDKNSNVMAAKMQLDSILQTGKITETKRTHATDKNGKLMFDSTGNPIYKDITVTRTATARDIQKAKDTLKTEKKRILNIELHRGKNADLMSAVKSVDTIREKGFKEGYSGFSEESLLDTTISSKDRASNFFDYKKNAEKESREITNQGGSRHEEYERAKANAKYNKKK